MEHSSQQRIDQLLKDGSRETNKRMRIKDAALEALNLVTREWGGTLKRVDYLVLEGNIDESVWEATPGQTTEQLSDAIIKYAKDYFKSLRYESKNPNMPAMGEAMASFFEEKFLEGIRSIR